MALGSVPYAVYAEKALGLDVSIKAADIPPIFVTQDELTAAINTEATARQAADTNLQNQINTANTNITTLQGQMTTANTNITNLQNQMSTANSNITNLQTTVSNHESRITTLENKPLPDISTLPGQVTEGQVPYFMRPFAFGTATYSSGSNTWSGPLAGAYNVSNASGSLSAVTITFQNQAPNTNYVVIATHNNANGNIDHPLFVSNKHTTDFAINIADSASAVSNIDFVVFGNF